MPLFPLRRSQNERISTFLSEVRASVKVVTINLLRIMELKSRFGSEDELKLRLDATVSELRNLKAILEKQNLKLKELDDEAYEAIRLMEAYSIISEREGTAFIDENAERVLRAARWCDGSISRAIKNMKR